MPIVAIDAPDGACNNAVTPRTGARVAEGTGLLNCNPAGLQIDGNADDNDKVGENRNSKNAPLVAVLDMEPELASVVSCWRLLDRVVKDKILSLAGVP